MNPELLKEMTDCRRVLKKLQSELGTFSVLESRGDSKTEGDLSKGHRSWRERALIRKMWDNLSIKMTGEGNGLHYIEFKNL